MAIFAPQINELPKTMSNSASRQPGFWARVWDLYYDGFRSMTVGRQLWALIIIKLIIIFAVLKAFFFPDILQRDYATDDERAQAVRTALTSR